MLWDLFLLSPPKPRTFVCAAQVLRQKPWVPATAVELVSPDDSLLGSQPRMDKVQLSCIPASDQPGAFFFVIGFGNNAAPPLRPSK